jgi:adenosine kinase
MRTLICGSIAFDTIMVFNGHFKDHILPDQVHALNVAFLVPSMRREFGGTAGNIGYNLKLLNGEPVIMATVGDDATAYRERLAKLKLDDAHVRTIPASFTAQAFITTDLADNQITAFHPGAMGQSHENHVADAKDIRLGIVSPDGRDGMLQHAREFASAGIPFVFDPGQGLPMFDGPELLNFVSLAAVVTVNDYEAKMLVDKTGVSLESISTGGKTLIVTRGAEGSDLYRDGKSTRFPAVPASHLVDPTGCGDAYRAGLLYGMAHDFDWDTSIRLGSLLGAIKIASGGPQNHAPSGEAIAEQFFEAFGYRF